MLLQFKLVIKFPFLFPAAAAGRGAAPGRGAVPPVRRIPALEALKT
ncbi:hypothetical protein Patl1_09399 [Pistacia atlantica]|uniref:Uncharacterized protein n=1 Tax=Pistacia atlantica TaxID=434234 RepID=A0ACC1AKA1_9ROSI|nr:hypothetical protein Patl1_09399 [Pistacia atlantica]